MNKIHCFYKSLLVLNHSIGVMRKMCIHFLGIIKQELRDSVVIPIQSIAVCCG